MMFIDQLLTVVYYLYESLWLTSEMGWLVEPDNSWLQAGQKQCKEQMTCAMIHCSKALIGLL